MGYLSIPNLYREQDILLFRECYALEKIEGTSAHVSYRNGRLHFSSGGAPSDKFRSIFNEEDLIQKLKDKIGVEDVTIYGEAYGGKIQRMSETYGKNLKFVVFDIHFRNVWLAVPQACDFTTSLGLEFVHYVKVSTDLASLDRERDAESVQAIRNGMGSGKLREGVILRPLIEVRKNNDERVISKHKNENFRETLTTREVDPSKLKVLEETDAIVEEWVTAKRLDHVLDKIPQPWDMKQTPQVIAAMVADVIKEGSGEFIDSPDVRKAIGRKTVELFKAFFKNRLQEVGS